ncbi:MAG: hypothetical protein LBS19_15760 [Clostridiales bacterium]|nr:hypothetical protein [Clostridiales bacterium]
MIFTAALLLAAPLFNSPAIAGETVSELISNELDSDELISGQIVYDEAEEEMTVPVNIEYSVTMEYIPEDKSVTGYERVRYRNALGVPTHTLCFNLYFNSIHITDAFINSSACRFSVSGAQLVVFLPFVLQPEQEVYIDILFDAVIPDEPLFTGAEGETVWFGGFIPLLATYDRSEQQFRSGGPYPVGKPFFSSVANFTVNLTTPADYTVLGAGDAAVSPLGEKKTTTMTALMVRDFAFALGKEYSDTGAAIGRLSETGIYIATHMYSETGKRDAEYYSRLAAACVDYFNTLIGGYPYKALKIIEAGKTVNVNPYSYPQVLFINTQNLEDKSPEDIRLSFCTAVARQWFYGVIGSNPVREAWLAEGLPYYAACLFIHKDDPEALQTHMDKLYDELSEVYGGLRYVRLSNNIGLYANESEYEAIQLKKAALMFHALRIELGGEAFEAFIRYYYRENYLTTTTREHIKRAAEEAAGRDLTEFFTAWIDGAALEPKPGD